MKHPSASGRSSDTSEAKFDGKRLLAHRTRGRKVIRFKIEGTVRKEHGDARQLFALRPSKDFRQPSRISPFTAETLSPNDGKAIQKHIVQFAGGPARSIEPAEVAIAGTRGVMRDITPNARRVNVEAVTRHVSSIGDGAAPIDATRRHARAETDVLVARFVEFVDHRK